jgi:hypothetical protein
MNTAEGKFAHPIFQSRKTLFVRKKKKNCDVNTSLLNVNNNSISICKKIFQADYSIFSYQNIRIKSFFNMKTNSCEIKYSDKAEKNN